jgi:hypothetical protein
MSLHLASQRVDDPRLWRDAFVRVATAGRARVWAVLRLLMFACVLVASSSFSHAQAQEDETLELARQAFEAGRVAYEGGRFEEALAQFEEAHRLTGDPDMLYNIGTVADRLRRDELALSSYRGYLAQRPDARDRAQIEARIAVLDVEIAARERERDEAAVRLAEQRALEERLALDATGPSASGAGPAPWVVVAVGGALLVAGISLVVVAEFDAACVRAPSGCVADPARPHWSEVSGAFDRIPILQGVGGALIGIGGAAAIAGIVWVLGAGDGEPSLDVTAGPFGVTARGRF